MSAPGLFETALGERWSRMPELWRAFHSIVTPSAYAGQAKVTRGSGPIVALVAALFRFPPAMDAASVTVKTSRDGVREIWLRDFGGYRFRSTLSPAHAGHVHERFGAIMFLIELTGDDTYLGMEVRGATCLGVALPRWILPLSKVREEIIDGRFHFDVEASLPLFGLLVRYQGWLAPVGTES